MTNPPQIVAPEDRFPGRVVLTFDDGPRTGRTDAIAACLDDFGMTATFYVIGQVAAEDPGWLYALARGGHRIGNHGWDHADFATLSADLIRDQIQRTDAVVAEATGTVPQWVRPPYGSPWFGDLDERRRVADVLGELGKSVALWQVDSRDWALAGDPDQVVANVAAGLDAVRGGVILMHDIHRQTVEALPRVLEAIRDRDLEVVDEDALVLCA